jgi:hypothetical protein
MLWVKGMDSSVVLSEMGQYVWEVILQYVPLLILFFTTGSEICLKQHKNPHVHKVSIPNNKIA